MGAIKQLCVFCGATTPSRTSLVTAIEALGDGMVARGIGLVYGGGRVGLMGTVADRVLEGGGEVLGVIPHQLERREVAHKALTELIVVDTMHERKAIMYERSDAFVAFPGGYGTLDEVMEILTWKQLGQHAKPVIIANIEGYFDPLAALFERAREDGLLRPEYLALCHFSPDVADVFRVLDAAHAPGGEPMTWA